MEKKVVECGKHVKLLAIGAGSLNWGRLAGFLQGVTT